MRITDLLRAESIQLHASPADKAAGKDVAPAADQKAGKDAKQAPKDADQKAAPAKK